MRKLTTLIILGLAVGILTGCGDSPTGVKSVGTPYTTTGTPQDRAAVMAEAAAHPEFMDESIYGSADETPAARTGGSTLAVIDPITFSRRIRSAERHFTFAFSDTDTTGRPTTAILTIEKDLTGTFNILADDTTGGFGRPQLIRKPLSERWTRRLMFKRVSSPSHGDNDDDDDGDDDGDDDDQGEDDARTTTQAAVIGPAELDHHGDRGLGHWQLTGVSGILIDTPEGNTQITSLRIQAAELDTTISDPLQFVTLEGLPAIQPGAEITVTATTNAADDIVLLLSAGGRRRLTANGDNTYSGTFVVPQSLGCHHFGVNALSHDTVFDDVASYDSESWLLPVRARTRSLASR